jgi:hypothetical protein
MRPKTFVLTALTAIALLAGVAPPAPAQGPPDRRPVQLLVDLGYVDLFSYPKWFAIGPQLEVRLGRLFSLNPGAAFWIGHSPGQKVRVVPELTANVRLGRFTLGGGAVYRISEWPDSGIEGESSHGWLMPKAQIGYALGPTRLAFSLLFPGGRNDVAAGLTLSMGLGRGSRD